MTKEDKWDALMGLLYMIGMWLAFGLSLAIPALLVKLFRFVF